MNTRRVSESQLPTAWGTFRVVAYRGHDGHEHLTLSVGIEDDQPRAEAPLVRVHSECLTGDVFGSRRCDCQLQLHDALAAVQASGHGMVVYLRGHEGRGIGLAAKIDAYRLQDEGFDTYDANEQLGLPAEARSFAVAADILRDLGVPTVRLISNNPLKKDELEAAGIVIADMVPSITEANPHNARYLRTKRDRMGHTFGSTLIGTTSN
ncbi:MAG: GTP cyclohydrolase II [Ilumatobacteraceae bacterium]